MISNTKFIGSSSTFPDREQIWIPQGNGSDIWADRKLIDYDSDSPDEYKQGNFFTDIRRKLWALC